MGAYCVISFWSIFWGGAVKQGVWSGAKLFILRQIAPSKEERKKLGSLQGASNLILPLRANDPTTLPILNPQYLKGSTAS